MLCSSEAVIDKIPPEQKTTEQPPNFLWKLASLNASAFTGTLSKRSGTHRRILALLLSSTDKPAILSASNTFPIPRSNSLS